MIFIGATQAKLPTEFAMAVQGLGTAAEYVKIEGSGRNTLDLHIAYYLGSTSATGSSDESFVIRKEWQTRFQFGRQGARLFFADEILDFEVIWTARPKTNFNVSVEPVIGRPVKRIEFSCGQGVDYGFLINRNTSL